MNLLSILFLLISSIACAQADCDFKYQNKKGGNYIFSIYYESDLKTPLNGTCERRYNDNKIFEKRTFKDGKLTEEELNYESGATKIKVHPAWNIHDTVIATMETYWENGNRKQTSIYYWDKSKRRCEKYIDYHINGKQRFVSYYAYARLSEINEYDIKDYPPHTIDYDGYTTLRVPFGNALEYDDNGVLKSRTSHQLILNGGHEHSSKHGPFEEYHHNGKLKTKGYYKDGDPDGDWLIYNFLGAKIEEQHFQRNMKVNTWKGWYDNGNKRFEYIYDTLSNFIFHPIKKEWNEAGVLTFQRTIDRRGDGFEKKWTDNGLLIQSIELVNNSKELGSDKTWYPSGQLKYFLNNHRNADTTYVSYFQNGIMEELHLKSKSELTESILNKNWNEIGVLLNSLSKITSPDKSTVDSYEFWSNGKKKVHTYQLNDMRKQEKFFENGNLQSVIHYLGGKLNGSSENFDSLGTLLQQYEYSSNLRNGWCKRFDHKGKLVFAQYYENGCLKKMTGEVSIKRRTWESLTNDEKEGFVNLVYTDLMNHQNQSKLIYSKAQIDSIAMIYLQLFDEWSKHLPFPFPEKIYTNQVVSFRLPGVYLTELEKKDTTNKYVKELLTAFDKYSWKTSNLKFENGYFNWDLKVDGFYTQRFIQQNFPLFQPFIYITPHSKNIIPLETTFNKINRTRLISINQLSDCVYQATTYSYYRTFQFLIYPDGEVDLLNNIDWDQLNEIDDFSREMPYD